MFIYRIENPNTKNGLWYNEDGKLTGVITTIPGAMCAAMPMGYDPIFKVGGFDWFSGCDNLPEILDWCSKSDLAALEALGYNFLELTVKDYRKVNGHAAFMRESVIHSKLLPFSSLYDHDPRVFSPRPD